MLQTDLNNHVRELEERVRELEGLLERKSEELKNSRENEARLTALVERTREQKEKLQRSEQFYKGIIEDLADTTSILKPDGTFLYLSGSVGAEWSARIRPEALVGRNTMELVHPDDREVVRAAIARDLEGTPTTIAARIMTSSRTWMDVEMRGKAAIDPDGNQVIVCSSRNVTERKKAERELAMLAAIVNASQDAIIGFSRDDKITYWNPAAERVYGYSTQDAVGRGFELFLPEDQQEPAAQARHSLFSTGEPSNWEERTVSRDGNYFVSFVSIFAIRDTSGNIVSGASIGRDITHLKEVERELREAHDYTRGLIESSVDAMVVVDRHMLITDCNERLARLTEVSKKVLLGSPFDSYFLDPSDARNAIAQAFADGWIANVDLVVKSASGKETSVSFNASLFYRAGKVFGIFGVARDVTQERTTERILREQREYSRALVQSSPDALLVCNSEAALTDANDQACSLTGYSREELIGITLLSLFTDPVAASEQLTKGRQQGKVYDAELQLLTKSAGVVPVVLNVSILKSNDTESGLIIASLRDITDARGAERERSLLAAIVDSSGDAIYSESSDLSVTSWNPAAEKLYGYHADEVLGRSAALLVPLDRRAELIEHARTVRATGKSQSFETRRLRRDGTSIDVAITQSPIVDTAGTVIGMSVTARDIGERKRMEAALAEARDAALEGARVKSEFLANMSHEIRTPLNSIIGLTGLLFDTQLDPQQREFVRDVRASGDALLALINNILDFSKMAAGKLAFEDLDFDLTDTTEEAIELISDQARRKGLELTLAIDPDVPRPLRGDPARLRQVLINLLANAVKFTAHGEVNVAVSKLSETPREAVLRFEVHDTGVGIAPDKQQLLFQPFTQIDGSITRQYAGSGLGLSIVRTLVEAMGGTVSVSSKLGEGATFWFTVSLQKQQDPSRPASDRFLLLADAKVLVVDDNASSRKILENQLSSWGMRPTTASSAEEGLKILHAAAQRDKYQLALLDVMMPEIDGIEMARRIRADPVLAKIPIIFVSSVGGRPDFSTRIAGLDAAGWLTKPVPQSTLYNVLVSVLTPMSEASAAKPDQPRAKSAQGFTLPTGMNPKVLLAEDKPINQKVAKLQLQKLGLQVDAVFNGREALEAQAAHPYDLIFMDCQMPELDGYEATRKLRQREGSGHRAIVIAMTAHALPGDREKCLAAGMDAYISKPVTQASLEAALRELFPPLSSAANDAAAPS